MSVAVKVVQPSITMARSAFSCKATRHFAIKRKKWAVKLGEPHRPVDLPTEGGVFHRKVTKGAGFWPAPRREPSAGATDAGDTLHLVKPWMLNPSPAAPRRSAMSHRS